MKKHRDTSRPTGIARLRSFLTFRHHNPVARLVSIVAALATAMLLVVGIGPAYAVHDNGMFELDGNTAHNSGTTPPFDWESLFNASGDQIVTPDPDNGPVLASTFIQDTTTPDATYFAENKDIEPISAWGCGPINNPTNKDDLQNSYAALVQVPNNAPDNAGHKVLYLGSERDSNNGTSFAGFWLMKNSSVGCNPPGDFTGGHTNGDVLVVSDYTNGGGTQDVSVYKWVGGNTTNSSTSNLQLIASGGVCGGNAHDNVCAIANATAITTPWTPHSHDTNTFVETGIDLTNVLGAGGCFTTFLSETRSSDQLTATLKDYAGGQFDTCPPAPLETDASGGSTEALGSSQTDVATLSAVGGRPVPTGTVAFFLCQPSQVTAGVGCDTGDGTQVGGAITVAAGSATSAATTNTNTPGTYCWRAEYTPDTAGATNYTSSSHTNDSTECFTVVKNSPTVTTLIQTAGTGLGFTTLGDEATLHGAFGNVTGETVTFKLYGPYAEGVTPDCAGADLLTTETAQLDGSGVATIAALDMYTPTEVGKYVWVASYPGDANNNAFTAPCDDTDESATIGGSVVSVAKSANPVGPVTAGSPIGFDIIVTNESAFPATGVHVTDALPAGADGVTGGTLDWSLSPAYTGCSITGAVGSEVLDCTFAEVAPGSLPAIHITSATVRADCGVVKNQAAVTTTNGIGGESAVASVTVFCPIVAPPAPPEVEPPAALPNTGGPNAMILGAGALLLLGGSGLLVGDRRRRHRS